MNTNAFLKLTLEDYAVARFVVGGKGFMTDFISSERKLAQWLEQTHCKYASDDDFEICMGAWSYTAKEVLKEYVSREIVGFALVLFKKKISEIRRDNPGLQRVSVAVRELESDLLK